MIKIIMTWQLFLMLPRIRNPSFYPLGHDSLKVIILITISFIVLSLRQNTFINYKRWSVHILSATIINSNRNIRDFVTIVEKFAL